LCSVLLIIVCSFVLFNYAIVFLSFDFRYIFKLFLVPTGTLTKHNKYVSNQKLEHFMSVSENVLIASGVFVLSICSIALEIKDTIDTSKSVSYLNIHLEINNGKCQLNVRQKRLFQFSHCYISI
jgi:hypothetical protein